MKLKNWNPFTKIDDALMTKVFTPVGHYWEYKTGQTPFRLSWAGFGVAFAGCAGTIIADYQKGSWVGVGMGGLCCGILFLQVKATDQADKDNQGRFLTKFTESTASVLHWATTSRAPRILWACITLVDSAALLPLSLRSACNFLWALGNMIAWYFVGVQRPPPKVQREEADTRHMVPVRGGN